MSIETKASVETIREEGEEEEEEKRLYGCSRLVLLVLHNLVWNAKVID